MGDRLRVGVPPRYVTSHLCQLSLLPSAGREMHTDQTAVMICGWGVKAGRRNPFVKKTSGWHVRLYEPLLTRAIPSEVGIALIIRRYTGTNVLFT